MPTKLHRKLENKRKGAAEVRHDAAVHAVGMGTDGWAPDSGCTYRHTRGQLGSGKGEREKVGGEQEVNCRERTRTLAKSFITKDRRGGRVACKGDIHPEKNKRDRQTDDVQLRQKQPPLPSLLTVAERSYGPIPVSFHPHKTLRERCYIYIQFTMRKLRHGGVFMNCIYVSIYLLKREI